MVLLLGALNLAIRQNIACVTAIYMCRPASMRSNTMTSLRGLFVLYVCMYDQCKLQRPPHEIHYSAVGGRLSAHPLVRD
jgi:hypothetical protein